MTRALVVYESMWGNSELVAHAVAEGVAEVMPVDVTDVAAAPVDLEDVTLVLVGGPTHGHAMSRQKTRRDAREHGALHGSIGTGLREWLDELPDESQRWLAAFDTRVTTSRLVPGSASSGVAREGRKHHFHRAARPKSFYLLDPEGPPADGELARARDWGRLVASSVPAPGQAEKGRHGGRVARREAADAADAAHVSGPADAARPDLVLPDHVTAQAALPGPGAAALTAPGPAPAPLAPPPPRPGAAPAGDYDPPLHQLVDRVRALRARIGPGRPVLIGVAGEPGSGKSTLTASLVAALQEDGTTAVLVPMDGFHLANVALAALGRAERKGAIDTFDGAGYTALLTRLRGAGPDTVWAPTYDRSIEESVANAIAVPAGIDVVVTEGNYLLVDDGPWSAVRWLLDEAWAVEVDAELRMERLVARHIEFGKPPEQAVAWVESVDVPNAQFVRSTFGRADLVVRGT
jgi:pantothenate kinase